jgi:ATP-binding cassette subfamily B protein
VLALLAIDWTIALGAGLVVGLVYVVAMAVSRRPLQVMGQRQMLLNRQLIQALQEGLGAIRDVLLDGTQAFYADTYQRADQPLRRTGADAGFISTYPRLVLEPVGMALIAVIGLVLVRQHGVATALPLLGALALGAQRLLPVVQKVYEGWAQTRNSKGSLEKVLELLAQPMPPRQIQGRAQPLALRQGLRFEAVYFAYGPELPDVLQGIDLEILPGKRIGIIGTTGSGKSTTLDLLMGLLLPTAGDADGGVRGGVRGRSRRGGDFGTVALRALTSAATEPGASGFATPGSYTTESGGGRTTAALAAAAPAAGAAAADEGWPSPPLLPAPAPQM